ncbi:MAG: CoA transferase [Alphaproteobacteria bacterium]|nr:CoA transferase [Alphaproteobacteria bacterium]MCB9928089.1 CoA transferase [Alphaproteobacteria bacterium]
MRALEGIRVVDFTQVIAGPFATQHLALLGADVVKIEQPGVGDQGRKLLGDNDWGKASLSPMFLACNAGKRSITLDLKSEAAKPIVWRLIERADVVMENFKAGVIEKLGFGYEAVKAVKPDIVYCSVTGYGQTGPYAGAAAYDGAIQATSGMIAVTGLPETPVRAGFMSVDVPTAISATMAILGALVRRERTGQGQQLDVSMLDTAMTILGPQVSNYLNTGADSPRVGNSSPALIPTAGVFTTADGFIMVTCLTDGQFRATAKAVDREHWLTDPIFQDFDSRKQHYHVVEAAMHEAFSARTTAEWDRIMGEAKVPAAPVNSLPDASKHPQLEHREVFTQLGQFGPIQRPAYGIGAPFLANEDAPRPDRPPPLLGQHNDEVLAELGYSSDEIAALREAGTI